MLFKRLTKFFSLFFASYIFVYGLFFAFSTYAATLSFSPSSGNFTVGNIFSVGAVVDTQKAAINGSDVTINFPTELLEIISVNKSGSIFSLWVEEPSFSNAAGTVSFIGGLPTPGYNGVFGKIINIVFRAKKVGAASLLYASSAVRANDGKGTDILETRIPAHFNIIAKATLPPPLPPVVAPGVPERPRIFSPTHPNPKKWYRDSTAVFTWPIDKTITSTKLLVNENPISIPAFVHTPAISKRTVKDIDDGVWYFHASLKNKSGWSGTSHFRIQIDGAKPDRFDIQLAPREDTTDPKVKFIFDGSDKTSGISYYEVQIDDNGFVRWEDDGKHVYETDVLIPGDHMLIGKAYDEAGNFLTSLVEFNITSLDPPIFTDYPETLRSNDILVVKGKSYSNGDVTILLQKDNSESISQKVRSDVGGVFIFVADEKVEEGIYKVWASATDVRGAQSGISEKLTIIVEPTQLSRIGFFTIGLLSVIIPIIALLILLLLLLWYMWHCWEKYRKLRKRLRKEVDEVEDALHKAFDLLREDMRTQVKELEHAKSQRELSREEDKLIKRLIQNLNDAEKFVKKEVDDIEKELK